MDSGDLQVGHSGATVPMVAGGLCRGAVGWFQVRSDLPYPGINDGSYFLFLPEARPKTGERCQRFSGSWLTVIMLAELDA